VPATSTATRSRREPRVQHEHDRPTGRQIYRLCADLLAIAGEPFPADRAAASALIERISEQRTAIAATEQDSGGIDAGF
jgi:hypothetical protein